MAKKKQAPLPNFEGLYEDRQSRPDRGYLFAELLETRSAEFGWQIEPHTHPGVLQVFLIEAGEFEFQEAVKVSRMTAPCLILIPSTVLHGFRFNENVHGRILTLSEMLFASLWQDLPAVTGLADHLLRIISFDAPYATIQISEMIKAIEREQAIHDNVQQPMLTACLQALFLSIFRLARSVEEMPAGQGTTAGDYLRRLQQLIRDHQGKMSVEQMAAALNVSAAHLNRICQRSAGCSITGLINDHLIGEAKKYLAYTNMSVAEIAYLLHFDYPNYFSRFFRQHTGLSPQDFRKGR